MKALGRDDLMHLGRLAQLELSDADLDRLKGELSRIVGYVEQLGEVDVSGVEPLAQPIELGPVSRGDEPSAHEDRPAELGAAPQLKDGMYVVPPVIQGP